MSQNGPAIGAGRSIDVRVGIVSWNTADLLDRCLAALPAALNGTNASVVVVDNASDDESVEVVRRHEWVELVELPENMGYARAMNMALRGASAFALIALNPDTEPPPGSLRRLVEELEARPRTALVAPRLLNADGSLQHSVHRFPSWRLAATVNLVPVPALRGRLGRRMWIEGTADHLHPGSVDWIIGAVHVVRAEAVGDQPYSHRWFMYVEDLDLCWRLHQEGWSIDLVPEVTVPHVGNAAGEQRWGHERTERWLAATYDWYAATHGLAQARVYAALNLAGASAKGVAAVIRGRLRGSGADRRWAEELFTAARVHRRAVAHPDRVYEDLVSSAGGGTVAAGSDAVPS